jgi:hypothetical protein
VVIPKSVVIKLARISETFSSVPALWSLEGLKVSQVYLGQLKMPLQLLQLLLFMRNHRMI